MEEEKVTSGYFQLIYDKLKTIEESLDPFNTAEEALDQLSISSEEEDAWADQALDHIKLLKVDFVSLKTFCLCLETWDFTTDEEKMERLKSIVTSLKVIWPKEVKGSSLLKRLAESRRTGSIQDFHSAKFELETKIQQSKQQVEGWCEDLMHSSMQCKSSTVSEVQDFLQHLRKNLNKISEYRAAEIVPLKKQIDILIEKEIFLDELLNDVKRCPHTKEILQFLNFISSFAISVACLTCLYWAKEANDEIANEMNKVLFDMMRKFIPCSSDITPLYTGILKSYNLQPSGSFIFGEIAEKFVDFFFEHLATTLKDDFPIIRDRLIFLFTFLTDPPCENAEEENLIRSQIHGLLHEDPYFLLPFHETEDDFCNEKKLLSDCKMKIDIAIAKIRQLHCGDSWIRLEVEKMEYIYFVSVDRELFWIEKFAQWDDPQDLVLDQVRLYRMELRFLRMFLLCFATRDDTDEEIRIRLSSMITSFQGIWEEKEETRLVAPRLYAIRERDTKDWHPLASELEEKIQLSKRAIKAARWMDLFHSSFRCKPWTSYKTLKFMDSIFKNLNDLVRYNVDEIDPFKNQIETLKEKLLFLNNFFRLATNCIYSSKELEEFKMLVQIFANDAACLTFLYWAENENDQIAAETNSMLSRMLQKIKPVTPDVARFYFGTLMAVYTQHSDSRMFGQIALNFVDLFLEDPVTSLKDDFQILRDDIVFLLIFLNNPPNTKAAESICSEIDVLFWEGLYGLFPFNDMEVDFSEKKVLLNDFMMTIQSINANIRQIYDTCSFG